MPARVERKRGRPGQRQRKRRLQRSKGLCEACLRKGISRLAVEVHHKIALAQGGSDEDDNTENLCKPCHDQATAEQFGFASVERGVDIEGRPTFSKHHWNMNDPGAGSKVQRVPVRAPPPALRLQRE